MMSPPLSPAARTRTSTSPVPATGSGCSSSTICWSRIVTARIAVASLAGVDLVRGRARLARGAARLVRRDSGTGPLEQRDALDVVSLREHVDGPHAAQGPAGLDELGGVGSERGGVAGDVDDPPGRGLDDAADDFLR